MKFIVLVALTCASVISATQCTVYGDNGKFIESGNKIDQGVHWGYVYESNGKTYGGGGVGNCDGAKVCHTNDNGGLVTTHSAWAAQRVCDANGRWRVADNDGSGPCILPASMPSCPGDGN